MSQQPEPELLLFNEILAREVFYVCLSLYFFEANAKILRYGSNDFLARAIFMRVDYGEDFLNAGRYDFYLEILLIW